MKTWIIVSIVIGILAIASVFVFNIGTVNADETIETLACTSCNNACTQENNCGLASCGAVKGKSCGCGG
jgi:hypothetical protein